MAGQPNRKGQAYKVIDVRNAGWAIQEEFAAAKKMYAIVHESYSQNMLKWDMAAEGDVESDADIASAKSDKEF